MWSRRSLLKSAGAASIALSLFPSISFSQAPTNKRFVFVILRGAMDGLAAVPPLGDPGYKKARKSISLGKQDTITLDGFFALHKNLKFLNEEFKTKELSIFHAIATPYRERSHFDGQDILENGGVHALNLDTGWLGRTLEGATMNTGPAKGLAISQSMPLVYWGTSEAITWSPSVMPDAAQGLLDRLSYLYEDDPLIETAFQNALAADAIAPDMSMMKSGKRHGLLTDFSTAAEAAGAFLTQEDGPTFAVLEATGWDTHANQGAGAGQLANNLGALDEGLKTLKQSLGKTWANTAIFVATEFGRTVAVNGSGGTDHGTGSAAFLLGGAVKGGRIIADWPGLKPSQLYEGRDIEPTLDMRAVLKGVLHDFLEIPLSELDQIIFPESTAIKLKQDLIRG